MLRMGCTPTISFVVIELRAIWSVTTVLFLNSLPFDSPQLFPKVDYTLMNFSQAIQRVKELAVSIEGKSLEEKKSLLAKCAATTLSSKLIGGEKEFFASMVVDAVLAIGNDDRLNLIGIKKVIIAMFTSMMFFVEQS